MSNPIEINNLTFKYSMLDKKAVTNDLTLSIPQGTRCLLVGSNGAGKTTLLNVLGGKHMASEAAVSVLGQPCFSNTHPGITVLSGQWSKTMAGGAGVPYQNDVSVEAMLAAINEDVDADRLAELLYILDVNLAWRMHMVSDGQRRRVQILMALIKPFQVLLLDEVTVDLDVVARADLLEFLRRETDQRKATVLYATHIFDGLDEWATHIAFMTRGSVARYAPISDYTELQTREAAGSVSPLLDMIEGWVREERPVLKAEQEAAKLAAAQAADQEKDLKLSKKAKNSNDPFARNRMHNYW